MFFGSMEDGEKGWFYTTSFHRFFFFLIKKLGMTILKPTRLHWDKVQLRYLWPTSPAPVAMSGLDEVAAEEWHRREHVEGYLFIFCILAFRVAFQISRKC